MEQNKSGLQQAKGRARPLNDGKEGRNYLQRESHDPRPGGGAERPALGGGVATAHRGPGAADLGADVEVTHCWKLPAGQRCPVQACLGVQPR